MYDHHQKIMSYNVVKKMSQSATPDLNIMHWPLYWVSVKLTITGRLSHDAGELNQQNLKVDKKRKRNTSTKRKTKRKKGTKRDLNQDGADFQSLIFSGLWKAPLHSGWCKHPPSKESHWRFQQQKHKTKILFVEIISGLFW